MKTLLITCTALLFLSASGLKKKNKLKLPEDFVRVPGGTCTDEKEDGTYDGGKQVSINGFYMSKYEVTNLQYRQFYDDVWSGLTDEERKKIMCDSSGWENRPVFNNEPMRTHYFSHPAYNKFPVVNIRHEGALKYCEWLQQKIQKDNPDFEVEVKLPARQEWTWAAMGGRSQAMYPWGNWYLRNKKGEYMCNFKRVQDYQIIKNMKTGLPEVHVWESATSFFTAEVKSFYPNDFGLYNMCGNAAEMISEKGICMGGSWNDYGGNVTTRAKASYDGSAPTVGFRPMIRMTERAK